VTLSHRTDLWIVFSLAVGAMLYVDLFLAGRHRHAVSMKEAGLWCAVWAAMAGLFGAGVAWFLSPGKALEFFTGYLIEQTLSVDNMFVFIMIFSYFKVSREDQPRVLKWGIFGAIVMRLAFIFAGSALIERFHQAIYVFGAFLVYTAWQMAFGGEKEFDPKSHPVFKRVMKVLPMTGYDGSRFFSRVNGVLSATPLFISLMIVEVCDVIFALDSIPAIFAVTTDRFIVYTSNVFAILGLRSMYFLLSGLVQAFSHLKYGVSLILAFVGIKMLLSGVLTVSTGVSLAVIVSLLSGSIVSSLTFAKK
jgi:tellurite resistance protein TerC